MPPYLRRYFPDAAMTYIDDIVTGALAVLDRPPADTGAEPPHRVYNLGNHRSEDLMHFVEVIEKACGREAIKEFGDIQPGDVKGTFAEIEASRRDLALRLDVDPFTGHLITPFARRSLSGGPRSDHHVVDRRVRHLVEERLVGS